ncbi:MAG: putative quinol monooxygenase [Acidobacteriota bacterium]
MIVVSGTLEIGEEGRERAMEAARKMAVASRAEEGCISYAFYADLENPSVVRVFEEWQDDQALADHFDTPHMKEFRESLVGVDLRSRAIKHYVVQEVGDL